MSYTPILPNPIEWNEAEPIKCEFCGNDLDAEEIAEEIDYCFECFFSCCGDELNQDIRICPTCLEHN